MTKKEIEKMRQSMTAAGVYTEADIEEICRLEIEYAEECEEIADQCEKEGFPSYGSNYEIRCSQAREVYQEQIDLIDERYE